MTRGKESDKHKLLKEYGKLLLNKELQVPNDHIYEEFSIGSAKFDVIAYPPVDMIDLKIIGIECGSKKSNKKKIYAHFKKCLKFVDFIIWIPYDALIAPFIDLINTKINELLFLACSFKINDLKYFEIANYVYKDKIGALFITMEDRYPYLENETRMKKIIFNDLNPDNN